MHKIWTIFLPLCVLAVQIVTERIFTYAQMSAMLSENGPVELAQFVVVCIAFGVALAVLRKTGPRKDPFLFGWVLLAAIGCFYIAGEEVSWGQHFLNWDTPAYWQAVNDQSETNLHNTTSWLDQKPRLILLIGIVVGGIVFPLLQRFRPGILPERFAMIYPPFALMLVSLLVLGPYLAQEIAEHFFDRGVFARVSEVQELYMYYFVLLYLVTLRRRQNHGMER